MLSTVSPLLPDGGLSTYPHSAAPHRSMRTEPLFPSVCQSPSGVVAGSSAASCEIFKSCGAGRAAPVGGATGAVTDGALDGAVGGGGGAATAGSMEGLIAGGTAGWGNDLGPPHT